MSENNKSGCLDRLGAGELLQDLGFSKPFVLQEFETPLAQARLKPGRSPAEAWPRPDFWKSGNLEFEIWNQKQSQTVGKVGMSRTKILPAPCHTISCHFPMDPKKQSLLHVFVFANFPWWMANFPWWAGTYLLYDRRDFMPLFKQGMPHQQPLSVTQNN